MCPSLLHAHAQCSEQGQVAHSESVFHFCVGVCPSYCREHFSCEGLSLSFRETIPCCIEAGLTASLSASSASHSDRPRFAHPRAMFRSVHAVLQGRGSSQCDSPSGVQSACPAAASVMLPFCLPVSCCSHLAEPEHKSHP
jgi:hypothetical protein